MSRLYSFVNYYLSDKQRGLQTAHLVNEFAKKYILSAHMVNISPYFVDWSILGETIIIFNGGNSEQLDITKSLFENVRNHYPWSYFRESKQALNGALTAVGIILPEKFTAPEDRQDYLEGKIGDTMDMQLAELLTKSQLA